MLYLILCTQTKGKKRKKSRNKYDSLSEVIHDCPFNASYKKWISAFLNLYDGIYKKDLKDLLILMEGLDFDYSILANSNKTELLQLANDDNYAALYRLGELYEFSIGVKNHLAFALECYEKSANNGFILATLKIKVEKYEKIDRANCKKLKFLHNAGVEQASILLSKIYFYGLGGEKDIEVSMNILDSVPDSTHPYYYYTGAVLLNEAYGKDEKKAIFKNLYSVFLYKASSVLLNATDNILISIIVGTIAVGYYSNYLLIQTNIVNLYALLFTSLTASVGNVIITEGYKKRYEIFKCTQSVGFIMAGILVPCYTSLVNGFIYCWLGKNYVLDMYTVLAIGFNTYLACVLQPLWTYREATGLYNKTKWVMVICALLNILLSILLGKIYGIFGIIIASGLSRISTYIWYEPKLLFKDYFNQKVKGYYVKMIINFMVVSIITLLSYAFSEMIKTNSFLGFAVKAILIFMFSTFVSTIVYRNSDGVIQIKHRVGAIIDSYRKLK